MLFDILIVKMCMVWVTWQNLCSEIREVASKIGWGVRMLLGWILWKKDGSGWNWLKNDCSEGFGICSESTDLMLENVRYSKSEKLGWPLCPTRQTTTPSTFKFMLRLCQYSAPSPHSPDLSRTEEWILLMICIPENVKIRKLCHVNEVSRVSRQLFKEMLQSFIK